MPRLGHVDWRPCGVGPLVVVGVAGVGAPGWLIEPPGEGEGEVAVERPWCCSTWSCRPVGAERWQKYTSNHFNVTIVLPRINSFRGSQTCMKERYKKIKQFIKNKVSDLSSLSAQSTFIWQDWKHPATFRNAVGWASIHVHDVEHCIMPGFITFD